VTAIIISVVVVVIPIAAAATTKLPPSRRVRRSGCSGGTATPAVGRDGPDGRGNNKNL